MEIKYYGCYCILPEVNSILKLNQTPRTRNTTLSQAGIPMSSLYVTAYYARNVILYGGMGLLLLIIGRFLLNLGINYYNTINPPDPDPPTIAFGIIPAIIFPSKPSQTLTYRLQTPDGTVPFFSDRASVFVMPERRSRFLALDQASEDAKTMGFANTPQQRSETLYRWSREGTVPAILDFYIYQGRFNITLDWTKDPTFLGNRQLGNEQQATNDIFNFLRKSKMVPEDLQQGETRVSFLKASGGAYAPTISLSEADFIQVDIFRSPIEEKYQVYTPDPNQGIVRGIVSGSAGENRIVKLEYNYAPVDYLSTGTYPLKDPNLAWSELQAGSGYIARISSGVESVTVRRIELGYFDSYDPQPFLQPIYVFKGDDNFIGYVQAIRPPITSPTPQP